ncbi:MAG: TraR/DksA C4-type zinc finger protein [Actinomycetota bacterium]
MDRGEVRRRLQQERARRTDMRAGLLEQHGDGEPGTTSTGELASYDQHDADIATETFEREKDQSLIEHLESELEEIDSALGKLDAGNYGTCEACGRPIGDDRLEAFPAARFCVEDQAEAERATLPGD